MICPTVKVLYASNLYPPAIGGSQIHLHCLAQAMQAAGYDVSVITHTCRHRTDWLRLSTVFPEADDHFEFEDIPVWQLGYSTLTRVRLLPWALSYYALMGPAVRHIASCVEGILDNSVRTPDLVHVTRNGREFLALALLNFAHRRGIPFVLTPNHHPRWEGWRYREYDNIYRRADAVCVLTEAEKRLIIGKKGVREEKVHITGVGPVLSRTYDVNEFRDKFKIPSRYVLFLGQQFRYKGVGAMLQAAPLVWKKHPDVFFVFAGPRSNYSKHIFSRATDSRLRNVGPVSLETKTAALAGCELLCLPSTEESFGGVFVEAWSFGKAVIGGNIAPIASLISDGVDGLLCDHDPAKLADAITLLLSAPRERAQMGSAGLEKVKARYTWERIAESTMHVYDVAIGEHRHNRIEQ